MLGGFMFSFKKIIFIFTLVLLFSVQSQSVFSGDFNYKYFFDGNSYGFKDSLGNIVIPAKFDYTEKFSEGLANVQIGNDIGRINTQSVVVLYGK
jgi:hypothetical protein